jgi:hypothetical protein
MSEDSENGNEIVVKVVKEKDAKTDTDREVEKFQREAELEEENEQLKEKLALIAENAFENKKRELGCTDPEINTPDQLDAWRKGKEDSEDGSAGCAPLSQGQITGGDSSVGWNSHEKMIEDLLRTKHNGNDEERKIAQRVLDELLLKSLRGVKEQERGVKPYVASKDSESVIERLNRFRREKELKRRSEGY